MVVARGDERRDAFQMGRRGGRGEPLRRAHVGCAVHPDVAVGPRLTRRPFDGVVAVARLDGEAVPDAVGGEASAAILDEHVVAGARGAKRIQREREHHRHRLVVGRAIDDHGQLFGRVGPEQVAAQHASIAHRDFDISFEDDFRHRMTPASAEACSAHAYAHQPPIGMIATEKYAPLIHHSAIRPDRIFVCPQRGDRQSQARRNGRRWGAGAKNQAEIIAPDGKIVAKVTPGATVALPPGTYKLRLPLIGGEMN